jgi:RHS repeat-associated protein
MFLVLLAYSPNNLRRTKTVNGVQTRHVWDGDQLAADLNSSSAVVASYTRGHALISERRSGASQFYLYNGHGDVVNLTNSSGTVVKTYDYDAWGVERNSLATDTNLFRYCSEYFDKETGNYLLRARYYTPGTGRFMTADTYWNTQNMIYGDDTSARRDVYRDIAKQQVIGQIIGNIYKQSGMTSTEKIMEAHRWQSGQLTEIEKQYIDAIVDGIQQPSINSITQSSNLYAYCMGNPIRYTDPSGNYAQVLVGAVIALVAYYGFSAYLNTPAGQQALQNFTDALNRELMTIQEAANSLIEMAKAGSGIGEHKNNARPSTENKHEEGQARTKKDKGGEKGDARRTQRTNRPKR